MSETQLTSSLNFRCFRLLNPSIKSMSLSLSRRLLFDTFFQTFTTTTTTSKILILEYLESTCNLYQNVPHDLVNNVCSGDFPEKCLVF